MPNQKNNLLGIIKKKKECFSTKKKKKNQSRTTSNSYKISISLIKIIKINECIKINVKSWDWFYFIDSDSPNYFNK